LIINKKSHLGQSFHAETQIASRDCGVVIINNAVVSFGVVDPNPKELRHC
jgi:hypothetical protein